MLKTMLLIGGATAGGVFVASMAKEQLAKAEFFSKQSAKTQEAISLGITAASAAGLFAILRSF